MSDKEVFVEVVVKSKRRHAKQSPKPPTSKSLISKMLDASCFCRSHSMAPEPEVRLKEEEELELPTVMPQLSNVQKRESMMLKRGATLTKKHNWT